MNNNIVEIGGIECYEKDGIAYLKLETCVRGLGFTRIAESGNEVIRWDRVNKYLSDLNFIPTNGHETFIPENIFYRLAMKAKNEVAEAFQAKVADEIIPAIRKHGVYATDNFIEKALANPDWAIKMLTALKEEREKRQALEDENKRLSAKAGYYDLLIDRQTNINFRDTAKEFHMGQKEFINFLFDKGFIYRDAKGQIKPYMPHVDNGLFVIKEGVAKHSKWSGNQTLITPKGRETFRLMLNL